MESESTGSFDLFMILVVYFGLYGWSKRKAFVIVDILQFLEARNILTRLMGSPASHCDIHCLF